MLSDLENVFAITCIDEFIFKLYFMTFNFYQGLNATFSFVSQLAKDTNVAVALIYVKLTL